jgi:hypothetical protein
MASAISCQFPIILIILNFVFLIYIYMKFLFNKSESWGCSSLVENLPRMCETLCLRL